MKYTKPFSKERAVQVENVVDTTTSLHNKQCEDLYPEDLRELIIEAKATEDPTEYELYLADIEAYIEHKM